MSKSLPSAAVLAAFGAGSVAVPLAGGQGEVVRAGDLVLKPVTLAAETDFLAPVLARLPEDEFRIPRPIPARDGQWVVDGWQAAAWVAGAHRQDRWADTIATSRAFHRAIAQIVPARPAFLDLVDTPWSRGQEVAWGDRGVRHPQVAAVITPLLALREPVDLPDQLVHADLAQNLLFADGFHPAVIDVSPCWRPAAWADAIIVADALDWYGADRSILELVADVPQFDQLLLRAEIFRLAAYDGLVAPGEDIAGTLADHQGTIDLLHSRLGR